MYFYPALKSQEIFIAHVNIYEPIIQNYLTDVKNRFKKMINFLEKMPLKLTEMANA